VTDHERAALDELLALRRAAAAAIRRRLSTGPLTADEKAAVRAYIASWGLTAAHIRFLAADDDGEALRAVLGAQPTYKEIPEQRRTGRR
jgi:hypothetical protein